MAQFLVAIAAFTAVNARGNLLRVLKAKQPHGNGDKAWITFLTPQNIEFGDAKPRPVTVFSGPLTEEALANSWILVLTTALGPHPHTFSFEPAKPLKNSPYAMAQDKGHAAFLFCTKGEPDCDAGLDKRLGIKFGVCFNENCAAFSHFHEDIPEEFVEVEKPPSWIKQNSSLLLVGGGSVALALLLLFWCRQNRPAPPFDATQVSPPPIVDLEEGFWPPDPFQKKSEETAHAPHPEKIPSAATAEIPRKTSEQTTQAPSPDTILSVTSKDPPILQGILKSGSSAEEKYHSLEEKCTSPRESRRSRRLSRHDKAGYRRQSRSRTRSPRSRSRRRSPRSPRRSPRSSRRSPRSPRRSPRHSPQRRDDRSPRRRDDKKSLKRAFKPKLGSSGRKKGWLS